MPSQVVGFGVVGIISTFIDWAVTFLFVFLGTEELFANALGFLVSVIVNYHLSMNFVFERRDDLSRESEFVTFLLFSLFGLALNELVLFCFLMIFGGGYLPLAVGKALATGVTMVWNFWSRKHFLSK